MEATRHDSDDAVVFAIDADGVADDRRVGAKILLPELMAQNHDTVAARLIFTCDEGAALFRGYTEDVEEIGRHGSGTNRLRFALGSQTRRPVKVGPGHFREDVVGLSPGKEIWGRDLTGVSLKSCSRIDGSYHRDLIGLNPGGTPQQDCTHQAEHGGVHRYAEGQGEHCDRGEARVLS